jgi:hypothetical protein
MVKPEYQNPIGSLLFSSLLYSGVLKNMFLFQKRFIGISFCIVLFCLMLVTTGCATQSKQHSQTNIFSLPKWKKAEPNKVKKDPDVPVTMGEVMMLPRNDVL